MAGIFKKIFFNDSEITEKQYAASRWGFVIAAMAAASVTSLVTGPYIAGILAYLGASEALISTIISITSLAGLVQFVSPLAAERMKSYKLAVSFGVGFMKFMLAFIMLTPVLIPDKTVAMIISIFCFITYHFVNAFVVPMYNIWFISVVPKEIRGKYFGIKDSLTYLSLAILGYIGGCIVDSYVNAGDQPMGYFMLGCMLLVLTAIDFGSYLTIREPAHEKTASGNIKMMDVLLKPFQNKQFRPVITVYILYNIALGLANPMFSIYKVSRLAMSYELIALTSSVGVGIRIFVAMWWGKLSSKVSWNTSLRYAILFLGIDILVWAFTTTQNMHVMVWFETVIGSLGWGSIGLSLYGFQMEYLPEENRSIYISCNGAVSGAVSFLIGMVGSVIIGITNGASINVCGFEVCDMQFIFALSAILCTVSAAYVSMLGKKEKIRK